MIPLKVWKASYSIGVLFAIIITTSACSPKHRPLKTNTAFTNNLWIHEAGLKKALDQHTPMLIIDVRPTSDYMKGHIATAVSIPLAKIASASKKLPRNKLLVLYCACPNSEAVQASEILLKSGFRNVRVLKEGYGEWEDRHYPIAASTQNNDRTVTVPARVYNAIPDSIIEFNKLRYYILPSGRMAPTGKLLGVGYSPSLGRECRIYQIPGKDPNQEVSVDIRSNFGLAKPPQALVAKHYH